jgi:RNA polymerase sigma-70 factor, ECF subfamily
MDLPADDRLAAFHEHRPLLFSIAYRMLGSAADAEDLVQEAYLRWRGAGADAVRSPKDYLSAVVTRLAVDHLRSARVRREVYVGPWLPEPLVGVDERDPLAAVALADSLSTAFLLLLERLTPPQRAAFLLREVFGYDYADVARVLETSEANCRQLLQRAKRRIAEGRPRFAADRRAAAALARHFADACATGDVDALRALLASDAVAWADGGGKFAAARRPVLGAERVARFVASVLRKWRAAGEVCVAPVSGGPGVVLHVDGRRAGVLTFAADAGAIRAVYFIVNPDKLGAR